MFDPKIRLEKLLYDRLKKCAEDAGYDSVDQFIGHVLDKTATALERHALDEDAALRQLRDLGYGE